MKPHEVLTGDQIFHHVDLQGVTRHFNTSAMTRAIIAKRVNPRVGMADLYESLIEHLLKNHGVEEAHLANMTATRDVPVLMVEFPDGQSLLVDGSHRVVRRWRDGLRDVAVYIMMPTQWEPFLVEDFDAFAAVNIIAMNATKDVRAQRNAQRVARNPYEPTPYDQARLPDIPEDAIGMDPEPSRGPEDSPSTPDPQAGD